MTTLTDFLLARIAEDEELAQASEPMRLGVWGDHLIRDRVLAECEAKRRIVEQAQDPGDDLFVAILATIYADHEDFQEEWRV